MRLRANFNWKLALFVVIFAPVTFSLGLWQLDRAEQKRQLSAQFEQQKQQVAVELDQLPEKSWQNYQNIRLTGKLQPQYFLIDNQTHQGKFGYEVIQLFTTDAGLSMLVSRGFIEGSLQRELLPTVATPDGKITLQGYFYALEDGFVLGDVVFTDDWPQVVPQLAASKLYKHVLKNDKISRRFIVRLQKQSPYLFKPHWKIINVRPQKHTGYAVQWFGMCGLLLIMFLIASVKLEKRAL